MALRARLSPPRIEREVWPWHQAKWGEFPASLLFSDDRRMEGGTYLAGGYGLRCALEARKSGWDRVKEFARVWQPSRLKGILVDPEYGTPFLAATQVFDVRPVPRKWLAVEKVKNASELYVTSGMILVTRSGNVGRATLTHAPHENTIISDDLLRVEPRRPELWGWLYAYLRSPQARAMMRAAHYGHVIKHLETSHLDALPIPNLRDDLLEHFCVLSKSILDLRDRAFGLSNDAEMLFETTIGVAPTTERHEVGFSVSASEIFGQRRRLEGGYYSPTATGILKHFAAHGVKTEPLLEVAERVWWVTRFKRVFGDKGMPYLSADELFTQNAPVSKRVIAEHVENAEDFHVKAGWILMACSGQIYGLNGSVALATEQHEGAFFSHDLIRIIPQHDRIRSGYLFAALGHPTLGRPLVIRNAYGTSIPHLDPADVAATPIVRLGHEVEDRLADLMEEAVALRATADRLENEMAVEAEGIIDRFIAGDTHEVSLSPGPGRKI